MLYVVENTRSQTDEAPSDFLLSFNKADWQVRLGGEEFSQALDHEMAMLFLTGRDYTPAWVLAVEDTEYYLQRHEKLLEQPLEVLKLFARSLRHHLDRQHEDGYFLLEHPKGSGHYHWIVGHTEVWDGVLYIEGGMVYPSESDEFGLSSEKMKQRFPDTPRHYVDKRGLGDDYLPPSLC